MTDQTTIILAIIAAISSAVTSSLTLLQGRKIHATFNSKMDQMLMLTSKSSFAEGVQAQKTSAATGVDIPVKPPENTTP